MECRRGDEAIGRGERTANSGSIRGKLAPNTRNGLIHRKNMAGEMRFKLIPPYLQTTPTLACGQAANSICNFAQCNRTEKERIAFDVCYQFFNCLISMRMARL